jgi:UDP-N-acetylglucosamine--N-acetylmuramyl-(pentapeptide) pyrophosphoryl-undecaprenol N-acetylglucosamine transferase
MTKGLVILAAGGTGGHLFPAQALAEALRARGYDIHLMTDHRVKDYGKNFPASETHLIPSASPSLSKPWLLPKRGAKLLLGYVKARRLMKQLKPLAVVGFGGYPIKYWPHGLMRWRCPSPRLWACPKGPRQR